MFEEYTKVKIKATGVIGTIVDKTVTNEKTWYIVEDNERDEKGRFPLYDVWEDDIEKVEAVAV